jgi:hypothetical protein
VHGELQHIVFQKHRVFVGDLQSMHCNKSCLEQTAHNLRAGSTAMHQDKMRRQLCYKTSAPGANMHNKHACKLRLGWEAGISWCGKVTGG